MSAAIESFMKQFYENLEYIEFRAKSLKETIRAVPNQTKVELQLKLDEAKIRLDLKKHEFDDYRKLHKNHFLEKGAEIQSEIEAWKHGRSVKKLENRADKAEHYAALAACLAMATIEEAETAALEAICSRLDADAALEISQAIDSQSKEPRPHPSS